MAEKYQLELATVEATGSTVLIEAYKSVNDPQTDKGFCPLVHCWGCDGETHICEGGHGDYCKG